MKLPFIQFYPADWLIDTRPLSLAAKGAWIDVLCFLHNSSTRGCATMPVTGWARTMGATVDQAEAAIDELATTRVCDVTRHANGDVTVICRRMKRDSLTREQNRQRVAKHRLARGGANGNRTGNASGNGPGNGAVTVQKSEVRSQKTEDRVDPDPTAAPPPVGGQDEKKPSRPRDPLFDALAKAEGSDPLQLTRSAARTVAVALAEIRRVCPDLNPEEIDRRARAYHRLMPDVRLTASALARHWAKCDPQFMPPAQSEFAGAF